MGEIPQAFLKRYLGRGKGRRRAHGVNRVWLMTEQGWVTRQRLGGNPSAANNQFPSRQKLVVAEEDFRASARGIATFPIRVYLIRP